MNFLLTMMRFAIGLYFILYLLLHVIIHTRPAMINYAIFMNLITIPYPFREFTHPQNYGHDNVHNFYLDTEKDVKVGIWHYIPEPLEYKFDSHSKNTLKAHFDMYFKKHDGRPIFIYVHGNDGDRIRENRRMLCTKLSNMGYHVFSIDYRGYGDSTGWPSEKGVVHDVTVLFNFIKSFQNKSEIYIWGHSLGTGISSHAAKVLSEFDSPPAGLVLEAPFVNISLATKQYLISPLINNNPWMMAKTDQALASINLNLNTDKHILKIKSKILILHAADDWFIPQEHSRLLKKISQTERPAHFPPVKVIELDASLGLGHNNIYMYEKLYPTVKDFVNKK